MGECYFCKGKTKKQRVSVDYRWGDKLVIIRNVPAEICTQCGERYFDAEVSRKMEAIALGRQKPKRSLNVPIWEFAGV